MNQITRDVLKAIKVFNSCVTYEHKESLIRYHNLLESKYFKELEKDIELWTILYEAKWEAIRRCTRSPVAE